MQVRTEHGWLTVYVGGEVRARFRSLVRLAEWYEVTRRMGGLCDGVDAAGAEAVVA